MIVAVIKRVAARLGNTPAVCRSCYVHPLVLSAYAENELEVADDHGANDHSSTDEERLLAFLADREPLRT